MDGPLRRPLTFTQDLSAGALSYTYTFTRPRSLHEVLISISTDITESLTITKHVAKGAAYSTSLVEADIIEEQEYTFRPQGKCDFAIGDGITIAMTNANTTGVVSGSIKLRETNKN